MVAQQFQKSFKRSRLGYRKNLWPRCHHLAHQLVAEFNRRAHQFPVVLFQDALFFAGLEQRLHVHRGFLFRAGWLLRQRRDRMEKTHKHRNRRHRPKQQANGPRQPYSPLSARVVEEDRRKNLVAESHHQHQAKHSLRNFGIAGALKVRSAIKQHRSKLQCNRAQRQLLQHRRGNGRMLTAQPKLRLNPLLPGVKIVLHLAGKNLAKFRIDAVDVRGESLYQRHQNEQQNGQCGHGRVPRPMGRTLLETA